MSGLERDETRDAEWRDRLTPLGEETPPASGYQNQTVKALKTGGVLRSAKPGRLRLLLPLAAAIVLFLAGNWWGRNSTGDNAGAGFPRFVLFLLEDSTFAGTRTVGHDSLVAEYSAWAGQLAAGGHLVLGEELDDRAWPLGLPEPASTPAVRITGFFVLAAPTESAALALARECPHLRYGGGIVVRPIRGPSQI